MPEKVDLDRARTNALSRIERSEKTFKLILLGAAVWELLLLVAFILLADLHDPLHLLLFLATVGSYTIVVLGLAVVAVYLNLGSLRVLKAIELLSDSLAKSTQS